MCLALLLVKLTRMSRPAAAIAIVLVSLAANPNSQSDFLRGYTRTLILANEANRPFDAMPHFETGSREQVAAFATASRAARESLNQAIDAISPYTTSVNHKIAESATLMKGALESRRTLCDRWMSAYDEMSKPDADVNALTSTINALRGDIAKSGEALGDSAVAAVWAVVKIDARGRPQQWAATWNERRAVLKELQQSFGNDIVKGPKAGQNYVQTAAAAFARFVSEPGFDFLPRSRTTVPRR